MDSKKLEKAHLIGNIFENRKKEDVYKLQAELEEGNNKLPPYYRVGRDLNIKMPIYQKGFLSIINKENLKITKTDFNAFCFAASQLLSNQSYICGNYETGSGVNRQEYTNDIGETKAFGTIATTLNNLCRLGYGVNKPTKRQKDSMASVIKALNDSNLYITNERGEEIPVWLCRIVGIPDKKTNDPEIEKKKSPIYVLILEEIFFYHIANNYAELPQELTKAMCNILSKAGKKFTSDYYDILRLLYIHDRGKTLIRNIDTILYELGLIEAHKQQPSRTENKLIDLFESSVKVGIITKYDIEYTTSRGRKSIKKVVFTLNPDFTKKESLTAIKNDQEGKEKEYTDYEEVKPEAEDSGTLFPDE